MSFVHLHNHTQFSLLDGACRIDRLFELAQDYRMPAVAITDHGNMFGAIEFYKAGKAAGVKPIIGIEAYIAPESRKLRKIIPGLKAPSFHLVLLAKNHEGYQALCRISTESYQNGFYYKPRVDKELLREHGKNLIALSACFKGEYGQAVLGAHYKTSEEVVREYVDIFGRDDFYLEIQDHGMPEESRLRMAALEDSKNLGVQLVATNDCHYLQAADAKAHDLLICIQTNVRVDSPKRMKYDTDQLYFKSAEEMKRTFANYPGAIENSLAIAEKCNVELALGVNRLPAFPDAKEGAATYLRNLAMKGFKRRSLYGKNTLQRLDYELDVIEKAGFAPYFLIVQDVVNWAKSNNIMVGPGRGSAAGSLVSYCLGITEINPLEHGLMFERFLNPDRISMPDIDLDFADTERGRVFEYLRQRYGEDRVSQIITFGTMNPRSVVRDVARVLGRPYEVGDRMAKAIPQNPDITFEQALAESPEFAQIVEDKECREILTYARVLEGLKRHAGIHAAGVVVAPQPLTDIAPIYKSSTDEFATQYDMYSVEGLGLLKIDVLGLKTLRVIDDTLKRLSKEQGDYEVNKQIITFLPLDIPEVIDLFAKGKTVGIFQFESPGMQDYLKKIGVKAFSDLVAMNALYRPGPIDSGMIDTFVARRTGLEDTEYLDPRLEPILADTHGIMVFQEQVMATVRAVAGYSLAEADIIRKAIGKKIKELMDKQKTEFLERAVKNGVSEDTADEIWRQIEVFAGYGFNKSHATGYAFLAYQTAYLKVTYPTAFMASIMSSEVRDTERLVLLIREARQMGLKVLPPDINESLADFTHGDGWVRCGLSAVKGIGDACTNEILTKRQASPFENFFDFCSRVDFRRANRAAVTSLILAGAFDSFGVPRKVLLDDLEHVMRAGTKVRRYNIVGQTTIMGDILNIKSGHVPSTADEFPKAEKLAKEKEMLGTYFTGHPLDEYREHYNSFVNIGTQEIEDLPEDTDVKLMGVINSVETRIDKRGEEYAFVVFEDYQRFFGTFIGSRAYNIHRTALIPNNILAFTGKAITLKNGARRVRVEEIFKPESLGRGVAAIPFGDKAQLANLNPQNYQSIKIIGPDHVWEFDTH